MDAAGTKPFSNRRAALARTVGYGIAIILFLVGIAVSTHLSPVDFSTIRVGPVLILALALTPLQVFLNAWEFITSSKMQSVAFTFTDALKVTVAGSIANYLPIPGAMMTKVAALKLRGIALAKGTIYTIFSFLILAGAAFLYAAGWIYALQERAIATMHLAIAVPIFVVAVLFLKHQKIAFYDACNLLINRFCSVALDGMRIYVALLALDITPRFAQAAALTTSGVLGLAVPFVPAGLGVRELASSLIAPVVGVNGAGVFLAASLIRIVDLSVLVLISLPLYRKLKQSETTTQDSRPGTKPS